MIRYKPILKEKRMSEWKGWFSPSSGFFRQFSTNGLHGEIAYQELKMSEEQALKKGYYRLYVGKEIAIESWEFPNDQQFNATKNIIEGNSYKKFNRSIWESISDKKYYYFKNLSFLFADSVYDGELK